MIKENSYIVNCLPSQSVSSAAPMFNGTQWITVLLPQWLTVLLQNHTGCCVGEAVLTGCCVGEALLILLLFYTLFLAVGAISLSSTVRLTNHARMLPLSAQPVSMQNWSHSLNSSFNANTIRGPVREIWKSFKVRYMTLMVKNHASLSAWVSPTRLIAQTSVLPQVTSDPVDRSDSIYC